jgi:hypothetical protein
MARTPKPFNQVSRLILASGSPVSRSTVETLIERHEKHTTPRLEMLWAYYRNPMHPGSLAPGARSYQLAQERGLPSRIRGAWDRRSPAVRALADDRTTHRKEIVVENDIAWRIQTMVDFMFGRPITIASTASDPSLKRAIEQTLAAVWDSSGGIALMQDIGLMGHVYGHVDLLVRTSSLSHHPEEPATTASEPSTAHPFTSTQDPAQPFGDGGSSQTATPRGEARSGGGHSDSIAGRATDCVRLELIEPPRGVALASDHDYRSIDAYVIRTRRESRDEPAASAPATIAASMRRWWRAEPEADGAPSHASSHTPLITTTELFAGGTRQLYETSPTGETTLLAEEPSLVEHHPGDAPPVVHIQNISQPFEYSGIGEVEPLIPLQDELNTRLSDRANRVTLQSFKMYLARGLDGASSMPIAPGIIWSTDNPDAQITAFGGDADSPSEERHIDEIREAMDKASAVPPLASGVVRAKIGNLSSENALRITLLGLMSKTSRKRITYGRGIVAASKLILEALHRHGILHTSEADRGLRIDWADPIPRDEQLALLAAQKKVDLGVPREQVLSELGY